MKAFSIVMALLCALSWYGLINKYDENVALHAQLEMAESNNSILFNQLKDCREH